MYSILIICSIVNMLTIIVGTYYLILKVDYQLIKKPKSILTIIFHGFFVALAFGVTLFLIVFAIKRNVISYNTFDFLMFFGVIIIFLESSYLLITLLAMFYPQYFVKKRAIYHLKHWKGLKITSDVLKWLSWAILLSEFIFIVLNPYIEHLNLAIGTKTYAKWIGLLWIFIGFPTLALIFDSILFFFELFKKEVKLTTQEIVTYILEVMAMIIIFVFLSIIAYEFKNARNGSALSALFLDWLFVEYLNAFSYGVLLAILFTLVILIIMQITVYESKARRMNSNKDKKQKVKMKLKGEKPKDEKINDNI